MDTSHDVNLPQEAENATDDSFGDPAISQSQELYTMTTEEQEPTSKWVRLTSEDGFSYIVKRDVAKASGTIKNMLDGTTGGYSEAMKGVYEIQERGIIVEKLVEYMIFKSHWQKQDHREDIPVGEMLERIPPEIILELLLAADYQEM